jgi:cyclic-di-GMP phosphodiesterase, flagellum assembly factor TipF
MRGFFAGLFLVLCAGLIGGGLQHFLGFARLEAALAAAAALAIFALFHSLIGRRRDRERVGDQIVDLSRGSADLARQVAELGRRVVTAEDEVARTAERARATIEPASIEVELLGKVVRQLAQSVAAHENAIAGMNARLNERGAGGAAPLALVETNGPGVGDRAELGQSDAAGAAAPGGLADGGCADPAAIRQAVEAKRLELYLQPIVTLPQRKVRYYQATARLRTAAGELLSPADYRADAQSAGLMPLIDDLLLFRCVQVVRRLLARNREVGLFCHVGSLLDQGFRRFAEFVEANRALAPALVFEFAHRSIRGMGPRERECLAALAALGFRFSVDQVRDLDLDPGELAGRGFRFVKVPAGLLLDRAAAADVDASAFSELLGRSGIDLIAEDIEREGSVVALLDIDVRFGQGPLFAAPRPVRAEALQGIGRRPRATADSAPADAAPVAVQAAAPEPSAARAGELGVGG